jgi:hypothetical protein
MHRRTLCTLITAFAIAAVAPAAQSQVVAPIKPGLWQIHSEREVNRQRQPDISERMKNMSPEKRAQIDAMMKQHGVASGAGGMGQVSYSRESLEPTSISKIGEQARKSSMTITAKYLGSDCGGLKPLEPYKP